jgi:hypothetical protein
LDNVICDDDDCGWSIAQSDFFKKQTACGNGERSCNDLGECVCPACQTWNPTTSRCVSNCADPEGCPDAACAASSVNCRLLTAGWQGASCQRYDATMSGVCMAKGECAAPTNGGFALCEHHVTATAEIEVCCC